LIWFITLVFVSLTALAMRRVAVYEELMLRCKPAGSSWLVV
jgi:hypothetical protein